MRPRKPYYRNDPPEFVPGDEPPGYADLAVAFLMGALILVACSAVAAAALAWCR